MKTIKYLAIAIAAVVLTGTAALAATTSELLQQGLYAEEVEGNLDSAIQTYSEVIKTKSAPPAHVAQALYRQGMCYLKTKDEAAARAVLGRLVSEHADQKELVEKARPVLDDLTDFDPATLMPPGTLVYMEFGSPGRQIETILTMLKGTPFENPLAAMGGSSNNGNQKSPGDIMGALLNPSMMAEFKKIRSSAVGIIGMTDNHPQMVSVLYPGKSDALRGLLLAGLGMAGTTGTAIEGLQVVNLPEDMAVAYDDKVVIMARPASQLKWCVSQYLRSSSEPSLATSNKSFAKLNKNQRQRNILTVWANVDEAYDQVLKLFPGGQVPPQLIAANAFADFRNIDDLVLTESVETTGVGSRVELQFKEGHRCLAYGMIRTPNISKAALSAVPADAVAVVSFALSPAESAQSEQVRAQIQTMTGLDIGREIFANLEQVTLFALPPGTDAASPASNLPLPGYLGLALTSRNPKQTKQVLTTLLGTINPVAAGQSDAQPGRYKVGVVNGQDIYCHLEQLNKTTLLSLNRAVLDASVAALKNRKSITTAGPLQKAVNDLAPSTSKLILVNAGGAIRLFGPQINTKELTEMQRKDWNTSLDQLARAADATTLELRTDEQLNSLAVNSSLTGIPPLNQILGPITQLSRINNQARSETTARNLKKQTPAIILPATKAPAIDGDKDEAWSRLSKNKLKNAIASFGSGEKVQRATSPDDLSGNFQAMWDENNLYLLVDVTDDKLVNDSGRDQQWYDDSVEIYIDADNAKTAAYGKNDAHIRINWNATKPVMHIYNNNVEVQLPGIEFALVTTDKGYRSEIKLPWAAFAVKPTAGASIGLDVHVNDDDDDGGDRDSKITWRDENDNAWQNPQAFGNGQLAGLVGWWKFDETQGNTAADSSGGNHNGTLVGKAKFGKGKHGGAIDLDGTGSYVRVADPAAFDFKGQATVACWVNFRSVPVNYTALVTKGDTAWRLSAVQTEQRAHFAVNTVQHGGDNIFVNSPTTLNSGTWHHLVGTYDGNVLNIYLDGKLDSAKAWAGGISQNDFEVLIGENAQDTNRCFDGLLDDVRIYNYALGPDEIKALAAGQ